MCQMTMLWGQMNSVDLFTLADLKWLGPASTTAARTKKKILIHLLKPSKPSKQANCVKIDS